MKLIHYTETKKKKTYVCSTTLRTIAQVAVAQVTIGRRIASALRKRDVGEVAKLEAEPIVGAELRRKALLFTGNVREPAGEELLV